MRPEDVTKLKPLKTIFIKELSALVFGGKMLPADKMDEDGYFGFRSELASEQQALSVARAGFLLRAGLCAGDRLRR